MDEPVHCHWSYETLQGVLSKLDLNYLRCGRTGAEVWDHLVATNRITWIYGRTDELDAVQAMTVFFLKLCTKGGW